MYCAKWRTMIYVLSAAMDLYCTQYIFAYCNFSIYVLQGVEIWLLFYGPHHSHSLLDTTHMKSHPLPFTRCAIWKSKVDDRVRALAFGASHLPLGVQDSYSRLERFSKRVWWEKNVPIFFFPLQPLQFLTASRNDLLEYRGKMFGKESSQVALIREMTLRLNLQSPLGGKIRYFSE